MVKEKKVKNRGEGKRMASSSDEWFLAIFPIKIFAVLNIGATNNSICGANRICRR
jgi:hypothetical protein